MNVKEAAMLSYEHIINTTIPENNEEYGKDHIRYMLMEIQKWDTSITKVNEKAMRWLGYAQCALVIGGISLAIVKEINRIS